ncbi:hypothetical protein SODALDRAFT_287840 [Sodiomyces alkalinus F11]|uniref:Uncharacterized protein n=1 Tax=Sodiomyces alkalinus (strain CBS 110278 / VKM F-3762 / F11) TaxID=1314773 RepID=A0A3N2Q783_SODAK|nr:hypothetical protein SODALDRAFT_287840 [Sodiomyces alkalinus F11]ROT42518.1 hypothetical protein SODALDRAFT_287840 [Sodiomyces alkalinus F11]
MNGRKAVMRKAPLELRGPSRVILKSAIRIGSGNNHNIEALEEARYNAESLLPSGRTGTLGDFAVLELVCILFTLVLQYTHKYLVKTDRFFARPRRIMRIFG